MLLSLSCRTASGGPVVACNCLLLLRDLGYSFGIEYTRSGRVGRCVVRCIASEHALGDASRALLDWVRLTGDHCLTLCDLANDLRCELLTVVSLAHGSWAIGDWGFLSRDGLLGSADLRKETGVDLHGAELGRGEWRSQW